MITAKRLFDIPYFQLENYPNPTMFVTKKQDAWVPVSTSEFLTEVMQVSKGLIAFGIQPGDRVAVSSNNRVEWNILDIAVQQVGAVLVPLYPNISESAYRYISNNAEAKLMIVSNLDLATKIQHVQKDTPSLLDFFTFDTIENFQHWKILHEKGASIDESEVKLRMDKVKYEDLATIIYTSGTTGNPKGVMLSHKNLLSNVSACMSPIPADNHSKVLSFLPVCHVYERMLHYLYMQIGCSIYFAESMDTIGENIKEVKPDLFSAVPRLIEKVFDKIMAKGEDLKGIKRSLFFWAVRLAEEYETVGKSSWYHFKLAIARKLIFSKWQEGLGGELETVLSNGQFKYPAAWRAQAVAQYGKFKTPTLRNVAVGSNRRYMHNGIFNSLEQVVHFYNTRDVAGAGWTIDGVFKTWAELGREVNLNVEIHGAGNLGLTPQQEADLVAFMKSLSDGWSATTANTTVL